MEDLRKLEHLSLVSKVCIELEKYVGLTDSDLTDRAAQRNRAGPTPQRSVNRNYALLNSFIFR